MAEEVDRQKGPHDRLLLGMRAVSGHIIGHDHAVGRVAHLGLYGAHRLVALGQGVLLGDREGAKPSGERDYRACETDHGRLLPSVWRKKFGKPLGESLNTKTN